MKYQNIGAMKRQTLSLRHGAAHRHNVEHGMLASDILSKSELQALVAAMID
tara:strand:+ start:674 stop:826 length:153 start_codon:yes stop_codon:yes gene_type:complete